MGGATTSADARTGIKQSGEGIKKSRGKRVYSNRTAENFQNFRAGPKKARRRGGARDRRRPGARMGAQFRAGCAKSLYCAASILHFDPSTAHHKINELRSVRLVAVYYFGDLSTIFRGCDTAGRRR